MFSKAITTVLLSGLLGGVLVSGTQMLEVIPLIIQAENYEIKEPVQQEILKEEIWIPEEGLERTFYTLIFNIAISIAFSLMLVAVFLLRGKSVNVKSGIFWGIVGFIVFSLAPSLGLPPELPGMSAAALDERQFWWIFTVILTAVGIGIITESKSIPPKMFAIIFLVLPHIIGAPHPHLFENIIPAELSSQFIISSLLTSALFWILVGAFSGYFFQKRVQKLTISS